MRVGTFNTHHGRPPRGFTRNRILERAVASLDADVLSLQEVERSVVRSWFVDQPARLAAAMGAEFAYAPARSLGGTGSDGVALCVRGRILESQVLRFAGGATRQDRVAVLARIEPRRGVECSVAATHLQNHGPDALVQLGELVAAFASWPEPRLVLGDLNLGSEAAQPVLTAAGFRLVGGPFSSPARRPTARIDHVAVSGLHIGTVEVRALSVSDHLAVITEVQ